MKKVVRLSESELKHMIMESVKKVLNESYNPNPSYALEDEASGEVYTYYQEDELEDAIEDAKNRGMHGGCYLVRDCKDDSIVFSTQPGISYKF